MYNTLILFYIVESEIIIETLKHYFLTNLVRQSQEIRIQGSKFVWVFLDFDTVANFMQILSKFYANFTQILCKF